MVIKMRARRVFAALMCAAVMALPLCSCGAQEVKNVTMADAVDEAVYDLTELEKGSEVIAVCRITSGGKADGDYTVYQATVTQALKGELSQDDTVTICQHYKKSGGAIISATGSKPLKEGDRWLFYLKASDAPQGYTIVGDTSGKLPVPNGNDKGRCSQATKIFEERTEFTQGKDELNDSELSLLESYNTQIAASLKSYDAEYFANYSVTLPQQELFYDVVMAWE